MGASASKHKLHGSKRDVNRIPDRPSPPGKPQLVPGTPHSEPDVVTIRWDPPEYDGGAKVTGYLVEHRRTGSPHWVRASPSLVRVPELTLSGLEPGWRYQFRVSARNSIGMSEPGELSELLTVTLQRTAASAPHFVRELTDIVALENDKAELTVEIRGTPAPTIAWYKDGLEIFSGRRHRIITENGTSTLVIHQTAMSDEGEIKCTATNRVGHAVTKATLRMEAPPSIRLPRQYEEGLLFEKDEVMRLKVTIAGRPEPSISWLHNGEPLPNSGRYEMTFNDKFAALRVDEARRSDRGEYQVRAINNLGEDIASFLVTVTDRPQSPGKAKVVMTLGRSVTLSWVAPEDDGGCKIGNYIVEYYRLGWNMWLKAATCRQLTTTLGDLIEGSEYKFRVKAENPYGVSDPGEESDILFIPDPNRGLLTAPDRREGGMSMEDVGVEEWLLEPNKRPRETTPGGSPSREHKKVKKKPERGKTPERQLTPEITLTNEDNELFPRQKLIPDIKEQQDAPKVPKRRAKRKQLDLKGYDEEDDEIFKQKVKIINEGKGEVKKERRAKSEEFHGSSEFMLVLLPHSRATTEERESDRKEVFNSLKDGSPGIAPPMSLSAPELGSIEPERTMQRLWVSSTELLHEKAMARFYQAVAEEEAEKALTRRYSFERRSSRTRDIPQFVRNKSITRSDENIQDKTTKLSLQFEEKSKDRIIIDEKKREKKLSDENLTKTQMRNHKGLLYTQRSSEESYDEEMEDDEFMESEMEEEESMEETEEEEAEYELEEEEEEYDEEMEEEEDEIDDMDLLGESESEFDDRSRHSIEEETYHPRSMVPKSSTTYSSAITSPSFTSKSKKNIAENLKPVTDVATAIVSHSIKIPVKSTLKPPELPRPMVRIEVTPPPGEDRIKQESKKHIIKPIIKKSLSPNREDLSPRTSPNRPYSPPKLTPDGRHLPPTNPPTPKPILKIRDHSQERILQDDKKSNNDNNKNNSKINSAPLAIVEPELNLMTSNEKLEVKNLDDSSNVTDSVKLKKKQVRIEEPENRKSYDLDENDMGITIAGDIARNRRRSARTSSLIDSSDPSKCLIHHYGDIIREFGQIRKAPRTLYLNYEDLKAAALKSEENLTVDTKLNDEISKQSTQDEIEKKSNDKTVGVVKINDETKIVTKDSQKYYGDEERQNEIDNEENLEIEEEEDKKEYKFLTETKEFKKLPQLVLLSEVKTNDDDDDKFQKVQQDKEIIQQLQKYEEKIEKYEYEDEEEQINNVDIHENKLTKVAEQKVRSVVDYLTDIAMFFIACWLYIFHDERLAIPVLILMVYRQAKEATVTYVRRQIARIPKFPRFSLPWRKKNDD